jgi:hypothetical protein
VGDDEVIYGKNYRILRTDELPEKSNEVDASGTEWESTPFRVAAKEDGLTLAAVMPMSILRGFQSLRRAFAWLAEAFFMPVEENAEVRTGHGQVSTARWQ